MNFVMYLLFFTCFAAMTGGGVYLCANPTGYVDVIAGASAVCGGLWFGTDVLRYAWKMNRRTILARFRIDLDMVCQMSVGKGPYDYHDYPDDVIGTPCHFTTLTCKRCGKQFLM